MTTSGQKKNAKYKMGDHYDKVHKELLPKDMTGYQWFYYLLTGKDHGSCIICKNNTRFNNLNMKYARFCDNPTCKQKYRDEFKERMIGKYGKIHLLNDPEKQKEMLRNRKISGTYTWNDKSVTLDYTGSYELDFLKFLDTQCNWISSDIISPSPHIFEYTYNNTSHFYIPDFFIPSLYLQIEIKDDGSAKNINQDSRNKDKIKDELMRSNINYFNYIKIVNKNYKEFLDIIRGD
jgi:hypothetical protein